MAPFSTLKGKGGGGGGGSLTRRCFLVILGGVFSGLLAARISPSSNRFPLVTNFRSLKLEIDPKISEEFPKARPSPLEWLLDPMDYKKPKTFFDISIDGKPAGRIEFELFTKQSPRAAENFRALCTGEKGRVPNEPFREGFGEPLFFKNKEFYRVLDQFICQTGAGTESVFGGEFQDDEGGLILKHDKAGLLSMANMGHDTNTSHFSIMMGPAHHLDGSYTIFGQVVSGMDVVKKINSLAKRPGSSDERPQLRVVISNCGEIVCDKEGKCVEVTFDF